MAFPVFRMPGRKEREKMIKDLRIRFGIIAVVVLVSLAYLMPTLMVRNGSTLPDWWAEGFKLGNDTVHVLPTKTLHLGLDLKGGMHLLLGVDLDEAVANSLDRFASEVKGYLDDEGIGFETVERQENELVIVLSSPEDDITLKEFIDERYGMLKILGSRTIEGEGIELRYTYNERDLAAFKDRTVEQTLETIRNRVDELGLAEPEIVRQGEYDILVQLPGVSDMESAKELIRKVALLEFKLVVEDREMLSEALKGNVPEGTELLYEKVRDRDTGEVIEENPYLLEEETLLTGEVITEAYMNPDSTTGSYHVFLEFDRRGADIFETITRENVDRRLAVILDNTVYFAPNIDEPIPNGKAVIKGRFTVDEAREMVIVLNAGALPATLTLLEERTVGPSLGADSIRKGFLATLVGGALVVLFMAMYYGASGLVADLALFLNMIIILGIMSAFQATLTLPGIAGIALTIGMAVDANVLVFERVREELRLGKTPRAAIEGGYSKAFLTILDANVTTLIAALVLFQFGTGPVKGFAVTLSVGILTSLFTAIFVSRTVFDFVMSRFRIKRLSV